MFYEKGASGQCYKSFAKWDLRYDKEYEISNLIQRGAVEFDANEHPNWQASRKYNWILMTDAIFKEEPISYFSKQMKKKYLPPEIKMSLIRRKDDNEMTGKLGRTVVKISDNCEMVIPDTFEKEKWEHKNDKSNIPIKIQMEQIRASQKELSSNERRDLKYRIMFETLNELSSREKDFDRYKRMI